MRMRKNLKAILAVVIIVVPVLSYFFYQVVSRPRYVKYQDSFFDTFDTVVTVVAYTRNKDEFDQYFNAIHQRFQELHKLYDIYDNYPGINNIKTINDEAGVRPVKVQKEIIDLILFSKDWYAKTGGKVNIAMGSVLSIWHQYREEGIDDPEHAKLPPMEELREAAKHTDINKVIVDTENSTVYLADKHMSLDVGAVAKGYAAELVAKEFSAKGLNSAIINAGGNVRVIGKPLDGVRERWGIGIQDPSKPIVSDEDNTLDVVYVNDSAVVSSGDYQRYYVVDGKVYHHIIDPSTLMPAEYYHAVTVVTRDSAVADFLSTTLFLYPFEESKALADKLGVDAIWVMEDGTIRMTDGFKTISRSGGATASRK